MASSPKFRRKDSSPPDLLATSFTKARAGSVVNLIRIPDSNEMRQPCPTILILACSKSLQGSSNSYPKRENSAPRDWFSDVFCSSRGVSLSSGILLPLCRAHSAKAVCTPKSQRYAKATTSEAPTQMRIRLDFDIRGITFHERYRSTERPSLTMTA